VDLFPNGILSRYFPSKILTLFPATGKPEVGKPAVCELVWQWHAWRNKLDKRPFSTQVQWEGQQRTTGIRLVQREINLLRTTLVTSSPDRILVREENAGDRSSQSVCENITRQ
jgi:hypothetical protein